MGISRSQGFVVQVLAGSSASADSALSAFETVNASAVSKVCRTLSPRYAVLTNVQAVSSLLKAKPTYVAVGDIKLLPYADELGL